MGATGSSSKRKYFKKKSSKIASEAKRRKKSRRKNKSRKLRHRDDSVSSYSDSDYTSSFSVSSSSSEDDCRSRKTRSRSRRNVNSAKGRAQKQSSSGDSSEDLPSVRKRKRSMKRGDNEARKKTQKKASRFASVSSTSSDSRSCSTCWGGSTSSDEDSKFDRPSGRSRESKKGKKIPGKLRDGTKKSKRRSLNLSPCSRYSDSGSDQRTEKLAGENNPVRLRSVVIVANPLEKEENRWGKDEHKDEIICDHDDYPSCRSNDSNDGGGKGEFFCHPHVASEKRREDSLIRQEAFVCNNKRTEPVESANVVGSQYDQINPSSDSVGANKSKKNESEASANLYGPNGTDLESILRQKALENLKKFQGGLQHNAKTPAEECNNSSNNVKQLPSVKSEFTQVKSAKKNSSVISAPQVVDKGPMLGGASQINGKMPGLKDSRTEFNTANWSTTHLPDGAAISGNPKGKDNPPANAHTNKSEPDETALGKKSSGACSNLKQAGTSYASAKEDLLMTKSSVNKNTAEMARTEAQSCNNKQDLGATEACGSTGFGPSSSIKPACEDSKEWQDEVKDGSQFEQKTMSVMRGGEMVQVSYKVYIPKKAPALARKRLQR